MALNIWSVLEENGKVPPRDSTGAAEKKSKVWKIPGV